MKRFLAAALTFLSLSMAVFAAGGQASAVNVFQACNGAAGGSEVCIDAGRQGSSDRNPAIGYIKIVINVIAFIIGLASIIIIIISGIRMATANGDPQAASTARSAVLYALIGIVIVIFAEAFVAFVLNRI